MSASTDTSFQEFQEDFPFEAPFEFLSDEEFESLFGRNRNRDALPRVGRGNTADTTPPQTKPSRPKKKRAPDVLRRELRKVRNCKKRGKLLEIIEEDGQIKRTFVPHRCGSILCPDCQEYYFWQTVKPYLPEMEKLQDILKRGGRNIKHITLTLPAMPASEQVRKLKDGFSKFLDLRLGPQTWKGIKQEALERIRGISSDKIRARQRWVLRKMDERIRQFWRRKRNLKVRHILKGLAVLDAKETMDNLHFHLHLVVFARNPISATVLQLLWEKAVGMEANVHVKEHPSLSQLLKYLSTVSLPKTEENQVALVQAFRNVKRVWSFGLKKVRGQEVSRRRIRKEVSVEFAFTDEDGVRFYYRRDGNWTELYRVTSDGGWKLETRFEDFIPPPI